MIKYKQYLNAIGCIGLTTVLGTTLSATVVNAQFLNRTGNNQTGGSNVGSNVTGVLVKAINQEGRAVAFSCNETEAAIKAKNGPSITFTKTLPSITSTIYIGYSQVTSLNKNPIMARFDNGQRTWCRTDYETTNDDGTGFGIAWNGTDTLYGVFSATGTQPGNDFRRYAGNGWLSSYGSGGGPKVSIIARINENNGDIYEATYVSAYRASTRLTNSLIVTDLAFSNGNLVVKADSWWSPRKPDRSAMTCEGNSPFKYSLTFKPTQLPNNSKIYYLNTVISASVTPVTINNVVSKCS